MCDRFGHDPFVDVWPSLHLPSLFHHGYTIIFHKQRMENNMPQHQRTEGKWDLIRNKIQETSCDILCLQETKRETFDLQYIRKFT
jgi:hypothetical protein